MSIEQISQRNGFRVVARSGLEYSPKSLDLSKLPESDLRRLFSRSTEIVRISQSDTGVSKISNVIYVDYDVPDSFQLPDNKFPMMVQIKSTITSNPTLVVRSKGSYEITCFSKYPNIHGVTRVKFNNENIESKLKEAISDLKIPELIEQALLQRGRR